MAPPPKTALRRASSLSKVSTPPATTSTSSPTPTRPSKSSKPSKVVRLPLSGKLLSRWPHEQTIRKASQAKASPLSQSTIVTPDEPSTSTPLRSEPDPKPTKKVEETHVTPAKDIKVEKKPDAKTGTKREDEAVVEGDDKEKSKANPRKRPKP